MTRAEHEAIVAEVTATVLAALREEVSAVRALQEAQGVRLNAAAEWATRTDTAADAFGRELDEHHGWIFELSEWHATLCALLPEFARRHPLDPMSPSALTAVPAAGVFATEQNGGEALVQAVPHDGSN